MLTNPSTGVFFLILFLLLLVYGGWVGWKIYNARKHGEKLSGWKSFVPFMKSSGGSSTNYPTPRSAGIVEWVKERINGMRNKRTTVGGYEDSRGAEGQYQNLNPNSAGSSRPRGRGLEDDAWDSRVGGRDEDPYGPGPGGYYEEQELGLAPTPGVGGSSQPYGNDYIGQNTSYGGSSSSRGRDNLDPFSDSNQAASLRSISPRPDLGGLDTSGKHRRMESDDGGNTSPISTRKSIFREDVQ